MTKKKSIFKDEERATPEQQRIAMVYIHRDKSRLDKYGGTCFYDAISGKLYRIDGEKNYLEYGTIEDGQRKVRIQGQWVRCAQIVWELYNGPIPPRTRIQFKDGNRLNYSIENLELDGKVKKSTLTIQQQIDQQSQVLHQQSLEFIKLKAALQEILDSLNTK